MSKTGKDGDLRKLCDSGEEETVIKLIFNMQKWYKPATLLVNPTENTKQKQL
jgi:hypothetical protein